jgi:outer membrane protein TolC
MRKIYLLVTLILAAPVFARAQQSSQAASTPSATSFTLDDAIKYTLENSPTVKNATLDERIADARVKETRGIGLPQVSGSVALQHNQKLPRFFNQYSEPQPGDTSGFSFIPPMPGLEDGDVVAAQNIFQLRSSGNASVSINQILFNGSYLVGLKAASTYRELSIKNSQQTKEQVVVQVTKAFYSVLINKDRIRLFDSNIERVESLLKTTRALNENGFAEGIDVDRIRVTLNNLNSEKNKFANLQELSLQLLKFQMGYPMEGDIEVLGDIASLNVDENVLNEYSLNWDYAKRSDYQVLQTNRELQNLAIRNKYAESMPSLAAFVNLGYSTQSNDISGLFKTNTTAEFYPGFGADKWYSASSFGVSLNIPIFSGLQRTYQLQQAKLSLQKIENGFTSLKSAIDLEIKQSAINYLNAVTTLKSQKENQGLAENVARVTKIKYEQGVGSNLEVTEAESALREAQINYYAALYDALVAKVDLDKAYGKLNPQNPQDK